MVISLLSIIYLSIHPSINLPCFCLSSVYLYIHHIYIWRQREREEHVTHLPLGQVPHMLSACHSPPGMLIYPCFQHPSTVHPSTIKPAILLLSSIHPPSTHPSTHPSIHSSIYAITTGGFNNRLWFLTAAETWSLKSGCLHDWVLWGPSSRSQTVDFLYPHMVGRVGEFSCLFLLPALIPHEASTLMTYHLPKAPSPWGLGFNI